MTGAGGVTTGTARERGIALVVVLWGLVLLAVVGASFATGSRTETKLARNMVDNAKARALADAGVQRAILGLLERDAARRWRPDGSVYAWRFADGEVRIGIEDEDGKIDLNRSPLALLEGLFEAVGLDADESTALVDAIADFRDRDELRRVHGAEAEDYRAAGLGHGPNNRRFEAVEELKLVLGMTPELYGQVAPALTVHSRRRRVNQATAPPLVLRALGLDAAEIEARLAEREEAAEIVDESGSTAGTAVGAEIPGSAPRASRTGLRTTTIRAEAHTATGAIFVREAVAWRTGSASGLLFRIEEWRQGRLPVSAAEEPSSTGAE